MSAPGTQSLRFRKPQPASSTSTTPKTRPQDEALLKDAVRKCVLQDGFVSRCITTDIGIAQNSSEALGSELLCRVSYTHPHEDLRGDVLKYSRL